MIHISGWLTFQYSINTENLKMLHTWEKWPVRSQTPKQVKSSNYLGFTAFYDWEKYISEYKESYIEILGIINPIIKPSIVWRQRNATLQSTYYSTNATSHRSMDHTNSWRLTSAFHDSRLQPFWLAFWVTKSPLPFSLVLTWLASLSTLKNKVRNTAFPSLNIIFTFLMVYSI